VVFIRCFNFNGHDRFLVQQVDDATVAHVRCHLNATSIFKKPYRRKRRPETSQIPRLRPRVRHCVGDPTLEVKSCTWVPRITLLPRPQPSANCSRACVVPWWWMRKLLHICQRNAQNDWRSVSIVENKSDMLNCRLEQRLFTLSQMRVSSHTMSLVKYHR
jgi:hypothetical protein